MRYPPRRAGGVVPCRNGTSRDGLGGGTVVVVLQRTANPTGLRAALLPLGMALLLVGAAQSATHAAAEARSPGGWTQVPSPNRGVAVNELKAVAVLGRSNAWAVG